MLNCGETMKPYLQVRSGAWRTLQEQLNNPTGLSTVQNCIRRNWQKPPSFSFYSIPNRGFTCFGAIVDTAILQPPASYPSVVQIRQRHQRKHLRRVLGQSPVTSYTRLLIMQFNQPNQQLPGHQLFHFVDKPLSVGALLYPFIGQLGQAFLFHGLALLMLGLHMFQQFCLTQNVQAITGLPVFSPIDAAMRVF